MKKLQKIGLVVALALGLLVGHVTPAEAARFSKKCDRSSGQLVLARNQVSAIVEERPYGRVDACRRSDGRRWVLGYTGEVGDANVRDFRLAGRYVGYSAIYCDRYPTLGEFGCGGQVVTCDAVTGRAVNVAQLRSLISTHKTAAVPFLGQLASGELVWVQRIRDFTSSERRYEVRQAHGSTDVLLASGADIDPTSIAVREGTVSWKRSGRPESAALLRQSSAPGVNAPNCVRAAGYERPAGGW